MINIIESALCSECGKEQIDYVNKKLCNRCYQRDWARNYYHKNKEKMRERAKLWSRNKEGRHFKLNNLWSAKYDCCIKCGTTEIKHRGHGLCSRCNDKIRRLEKLRRWKEKMLHDENFAKQQREKIRRNSLLGYYKHHDERKKRNREWYYNNVDKIRLFNKNKYARKRKELLKQVKDKTCKECGKVYSPLKIYKRKHLIQADKFKFCSKECSRVNWLKENEIKIKQDAKRDRILNWQKYRLKQLNRDRDSKKKSDLKYYLNNKKKIRITSRIREIFAGTMPHNYKNCNEILLRDIDLLKNKINELESQEENQSEIFPL